MRLPLVLLTILSAGLLASCSENKPAASSTTKGGTRKLIPANLTPDAPTLNSPTAQTSVPDPNSFPGTPAGPGLSPSTPGAPAPAAVPTVNTSELPDAPAGAQWTLYCQTITGPGHVERAKDLRQQLIRTTSMKSWYVIHAGEASNVYYGFYRAIDPSERSENRKDGVQAQRDRKRIDGMTDASGERPFSRCMFVELAAPDPEAPPAWNLANTPADMFWSVQIGSYAHHPDRKKFAIDAVREARARGIEAYFYHGASVSSVCVGLWPLEAVRYDTGRGITIDPSQDIAILPPGMSQLDTKDLRNKQGQKLAVARNEVDIVDPSLIATLKKYPEHSVNGVVRVQKAKNKERPEPSFMVRIPNRFVQGEKAGDQVNPDAAEVPADAGFSFLRPRNQPRERSELDYIPSERSGRSRGGNGRVR